MLEQHQDILTILELCDILMIGRNRAYELLETGVLKGFLSSDTYIFMIRPL